MLLTDTHCHISEPEFDDDREAVLRRAREAGVHRLIVIGGTPEMNSRAQAFAEEEDGIFWTSGLDPAGIVGRKPEDLSSPRPLTSASSRTLYLAASAIRSSRLVALGEIGLDQHHRYTPLGHQREMFRAQLALARAAGLPVVIHSRETGPEMLEDYAASAKPGGVWHSFVGSKENAFRALDLGLFISFSGMLTFKTAPGLREVAPLLPEDRILVETDSPYLAPVPHRGKRCEPAFVADTARLLASLRSKALEDLAPILEDNVLRAFPRMALKGPERESDK